MGPRLRSWGLVEGSSLQSSLRCTRSVDMMRLSTRVSVDSLPLSRLFSICLWANLSTIRLWIAGLNISPGLILLFIDLSPSHEATS